MNSHSPRNRESSSFGLTLGGVLGVTKIPGRTAGKSLMGFSLIELLTLITVIGVISSVAIPQIGAISSGATKASQQQNAQNIVSMFQAGQDGGSIEWVTTSRNASVADVVAGKAAPASSIFAGRVFRVPNISGSNLAGVYKYIGMDARKNLFYDKSGSQPSN